MASGQVDADREGEARDAAEHRADREAGPGEDEAPGQRAGQDALDDRLHERGLGGGDLLRAELVGARRGGAPSPPPPSTRTPRRSAARAAAARASRPPASPSSGPARCRRPCSPRSPRSCRRSGRRPARPASTHPAAAKTEAVPRSVTSAMPEVGWEETPTIPTIRAATVTKSTPKTPTPAASTARCSGAMSPAKTPGTSPATSTTVATPPNTNAAGRSRSVRSTGPAVPRASRRRPRATARKAPAIVGRPAQHGEDPRGGHGARPDVAHVARPDVARAHLRDEPLGLGVERGREARPQPGDERGERHRRDEGARHAHGGLAVAEDVADAEERGGDLEGQLGLRQHGQRRVQLAGDEVGEGDQDLDRGAHRHAAEDPGAAARAPLRSRCSWPGAPRRRPCPPGTAARRAPSRSAAAAGGSSPRARAGRRGTRARPPAGRAAPCPRGRGRGS